MKRMIIWLVILTMLVTALPGTLPAAQATMCAQHTWSAWQQEREATCTSPGWQTRYCTVCGNGWDSREYPPALGHNFQFVVRDQPTCTTPGYGIDTCTRCGANRDNGRRIDALGHNYQRKVAQEATCTKDGTAVYTCSRCGDSYREPIPATGHKWGEWVDGDPATCVQYGNRYHQCTRCGQKEWERNYAGGLGDHDWGEWVTVKEPTATEDGLKERTCKVDTSHKEQEVIPATEEDIEPWIKIGFSSSTPKKDAYSAKDYEIVDTADIESNYLMENYLFCKYEVGSSWRQTAGLSGYSDRFEPGEFSAHSHCINTLISDSFMNYINPGTETDTLLGTVTVYYRVDGYNPFTGEKVCESNVISRTYNVAKSTEYDISASYSKGPIVVESSSSPERYWTAVNVLSENGGIDWRYHYGYADSSDVTVDRIVWREFRDGGSSGAFCFDPTIIKPQDHIAPGTETEEYAGEATLLVWAVGYLPDTDTEVTRSDAVQIPLLVKKEEPKPALTIHWDYDMIVNYDEGYHYIDSFNTTEYGTLSPRQGAVAHYTVTNTGNVPLEPIHVGVYGDGWSHRIGWTKTILEPGESLEGWDPLRFDHMNSGSETDELYGSCTVNMYVVGFEPGTTSQAVAGGEVVGTELCRTETITRTWEIRKPGPEPWAIPEESKLTVSISEKSWMRTDPAGYQLTEMWGTNIYVHNEGQVDVPEYTLHVDYVADDERANTFADDNDASTWYEFTRGSSVPAGEERWSLSPYGYITAQDVARGYVQAIAYVTWVDPDSGNLRESNHATVTLPIISKTGLLLNKGFKDPANGEYFEEGEQIEWTLSMKNNSKEPIKDITVKDNGATIGMFAEVTPEQGEIKLGVPKYTVTEYDAKVIGKVTNIANATGTDLKGVEHTYPSNPAVAKAGNKAPDPNDGDGGGGTDPLGPIYGYDIAVSIIKTEAHGPAQEDWYALNENVDYTVTVKNTGKDPIENVTVYDSLNGFAPIGSVGSLAPGEEKTFSFTWKVTPYNVDVMHYVVNQATVTYTFGGGINGTPMKSNKVYVKAGENGFIPEDGLIDPDGDPDGHFDPCLLHGEGDDCCAMTLLRTRDNET